MVTYPMVIYLMVIYLISGPNRYIQVMGDAVKSAPMMPVLDPMALPVKSQGKKICFLIGSDNVMFSRVFIGWLVCLFMIMFYDWSRVHHFVSSSKHHPKRTTLNFRDVSGWCLPCQSERRQNGKMVAGLLRGAIRSTKCRQIVLHLFMDLIRFLLQEYVHSPKIFK